MSVAFTGCFAVDAEVASNLFVRIVVDRGVSLGATVYIGNVAIPSW